MSYLDNLSDEELEALVKEQEEKARNSEVTEEERDGGVFEDVAAFTEAATNMSTFGLAGALDTYGQAGAGYVLDRIAPWREDTDRSYMDIVKEIQEQKRGLRERNPIASTAGDVAGAVGSGVLLGPALTARAPAALSSNIAGRSLLAGGVGAAENVGTAASRGETDNLLTEAALGAAGGGLGNVLGEGVVRAGRGIGRAIQRSEITDSMLNRALGYNPLKEQGKQAAREALETTGVMGEDALQAIGPRVSSSRSGRALVEEALPSMRPDNILADVSDDLAADTANMLASGNTVGQMREPLKQLAETRIAGAEEAAFDLTKKYLSPTQSKVDSLAEFEEIRKAAGVRYDNLFSSARAKKLVKPREQVATRLRRAFGPDRSARTDARMGAVMRDIIGDDTAIGKAGKPLSADQLLTLKKEVDDQLITHVRAVEGGNPSNLNNASYVALSDFKKYLNNQIADILPEYKKLAKEFSDNELNKTAVESAAKMLRSNNVSPAEYKAAYDALTPAEQKHFLDGMFQQVQSTINEGGIGGLNKAIKQPKWLKKVQAVIPDNRIDDFLSEADQFTRELRNAYQIDAMARNSGNIEVGQRYNPAAYKAAIATSGARGQVGSTFYPLSREIGGRDRAGEAGMRSILELYSQQGPEAASNLMNEILSAQRTTSNPFLMGRLGAMASGDAEERVQTIME